MPSFHIITLGCQMNYSDSARIKAVLTNCWFSYSETEEDADIIIFDTCSVRQKAEDKITGKLKDIDSSKKIRITWCMIQHNFRNNLNKDTPENLKRGNFIGNIQTTNPKIIGVDNEIVKDLITNKNADFSKMIFINHAFNPLFFDLKQSYPNLELFFRIDDTGSLPLILKEIWYTNIQYDSELVNEYEKIIPHEWASMNKHKKTAYIPISTGCNQFCAYCIVPFARGLEKHLPAKQIINEVKHHLKNWVKEISLLGQIVNKHPDFVNILKEILKLEELERLRYTSPYPTYYSTELLELHEKEEKLCPHIHIPLQSGSTSVLKRMFRGYTAEESYEFINNIKQLKRKISITTDIIIGFPDETEQEFEDSLKLIEHAKFDMIYMGIYSNRPWTFADRQYKDNIPYSVKHDRRERMNTLLKQISKENNQKEIWSTRTMIINEIWSDWTVYGYTDNMKQISIKTPDLSEKNSKKIKHTLWDIISIKVNWSGEFKLQGEII